jgi:predicted nucleic acid-binding protein
LGVDKVLVALDSNIFIAALSGREEHSNEAQQLIKSIARGSHKAIASSLVFGEVLSVSTEVIDLPDFISHIGNLETIAADDDICFESGKLRLEHRPALQLPDAIHLATAIKKKADLFITNDLVLAKLSQQFVPTKLLVEFKDF